MSQVDCPYNALLIVSFGGPEGMDDVMPFLQNVTRGRNIPAQRLQEVAHHYEQFGGVSPHNQQIRDLIEALKPELRSHNIKLPVYWGNRNWRPMLTDTMEKMAADGIKRALAFVVSAYSSYSSCRQYLENIEAAKQHVAQLNPSAAPPPVVDKIRVFYNHPGFIEAMRDRVQQALDQLPEAQQGNAHLVFTAHSIPKSMASACSYETQLRQACQLVCEAFESNPWELVYQSRSGPPHIPWLEPDVCDYLDELKTKNIEAAVIAPIGFLSDHLEVLFDLDIEAKQKAQQLEIRMVRAGTVGTHPNFIAMIRQLIQERLELDDSKIVRLALGSGGAEHDTCLLDCCPAPVRGTRPAGASDQKPGIGHSQD